MFNGCFHYLGPVKLVFFSTTSGLHAPMSYQKFPMRVGHVNEAKFSFQRQSPISTFLSLRRNSLPPLLAATHFRSPLACRRCTGLIVRCSNDQRKEVILLTTPCVQVIKLRMCLTLQRFERGREYFIERQQEERSCRERERE